MNNYIFKKQLEKTLIGKMYFLRYSNFQKLSHAIGVNLYLETFKLDRDRMGKFKCQITKCSLQDERVWSYDAKLMIYNYNDRPILTEELHIKKESLRLTDLPIVKHNLLLRMTPITIDLIPSDLYKSLMNIRDKDIINFSTKV